MKNALPINSIHSEVPLKETIAPAVVIPGFGGMAFCGAVMLGLIGREVLAAGILVCTAIGVAWAVRFMLAREKQADAYTAKLASIPVESLRQLEKSEELDDESRALIREFLNKNHPGWSLQRHSA